MPNALVQRVADNLKVVGMDLKLGPCRAYSCYSEGGGERNRRSISQNEAPLQDSQKFTERIVRSGDRKTDHVGTIRRVIVFTLAAAISNRERVGRKSVPLQKGGRVDEQAYRINLLRQELV